MHVFVGAVPNSEKLPPLEDLLWEQTTPQEIESLAQTHTLLGDTRAFRLVGALTGLRAQEYLDLSATLVSSVHTFVCIEEKLLKKPTEQLKAHGARVVVSEKKEVAQNGFNVFSLTYAFAARDKKKLWLLLGEALRAGVSPEAIAGILHWKVRDLIAKPPYKTFSKEELHTLSRSLVGIYHDSHRGAGELGLLLEKFVLTL